MQLKTKILNSIRSLFKNRLMEGLLIALVRGKSYDNIVVKLLPNCYQYPKGTSRIVERDGIKYNLDISNLMEWVIYFPLKEQSKEDLFDLVKEGDTVLDIGTHVGEHLLNFSKIVGDNGSVYGFEPDKEIRSRVERNIALNNFKNCTVSSNGLSDKASQYHIYTVNENNLGMNRIIESSNRFNSNEEVQIDNGVIECITLDEFVSGKALEKVDVIKLDVEGFEAKVLKGGEDVFTKFKPKLYIEIADSNLKSNGSSAAEVGTMLLDWNYTLYDADNNIHIGYNNLDHFKEDANYNVICLPA